MAGNGVTFDPKVNYQLGALGGLRTFQPKVAPATTGSEYGISIPTSYTDTYSEDGSTKISMGNDGLQLKHISNSELAYMQQEKGLGRNLFGIM